MAKTESRFEVQLKAFLPFAVAGVTIKKTNYGYLVHQEGYVESLEELSLDATFEEYGILRHRLAGRRLIDLIFVLRLVFLASN